MHRNNAPLLKTLVCFSLLGLLPRSAYATQFTRWENRRESEGAFRLIPELSLLSSTANYGEFQPAGLDYSKTLLDFNLLYGVGPRLTTFARISLASVAYETSTLKGSGFGLGEQALGLNYRLFESKGGYNAQRKPLRRTQIDAQLQIEVPLYSVAKARQARPPNPLLGEGSMDITVGPFITHPLNQGRGNRLYLVGGLAAMIRSGGYSMAIPYQLNLVLQPEARGLFGRAGIYGFQSLGSDGDAGQPALAAGAAIKDAGDSFIVNTLNPSYTSARLQAGFQFAPSSQLYLGYQKTLRGSSTANLSAITIGAQFRFGGPVRTVSRGGKKKAGAPSRSGQKRRYDLDGLVTQSNDRLHLVRVNKGESSGVAKGQVFDLYRPGADGRASELIARAVVTSVRSDDSVLRIRQFAKQVVIQNGFIAKRLQR